MGRPERPQHSYFYETVQSGPFSLHFFLATVVWQSWLVRSEEWTTRGGSLETVTRRGLFAQVWMWVRQLCTELCVSPFRHHPVICSAANPLPP